MSEPREPAGAQSAPLRLGLAIALVAAAMLVLELLLTRLFSVLFLHHYSFFAVSLVMSGLSFGGLMAARWSAQSMEAGAYAERLAALARFFAAWTALGLAFLAVFTRVSKAPELPLAQVALVAVVFLPGLAAAGAFLALAFARDQRRIASLYAADLAGAALACVGSIALMRVVQGPAGLLAVVALAAGGAWACAPAGGRARRSAASLATLACALAALHALGWGVIGFPPPPGLLVERWNEHSRIQAMRHGGADSRIHILIDKSAATFMPPTRPRLPGEPPPADPGWDRLAPSLAYRLKRPLDRAAIIGVGGGQDLLAPLANGAARVDGYELNQIMLDLIQKDFSAWSGFALWPEMNLIHEEGRLGIARSGQRYDVIQASLIDTWAATASGGFVLSENGLYTLEGWRAFIERLSDRGVLTMTRWFMPKAPAETLRMISLAAAALEAEGIADARSRVIVAISANGGTAAAPEASMLETATILLSKSPFEPNEIARIQSICGAGRIKLLVAPGLPSWDPVADDLLDPARRARAVAASPYDIAPPTDLRPYFFLQLRPRDFFRVAPGMGEIYEITFNGVRVMVLLGAVSALFALAVLGLSLWGFRSAGRPAAPRSLDRWMSAYFLSIGLGYMLAQLGLHQRLILVLGRPTLALSVVLFSMLLATAAGSALSRSVATGRAGAAWLAILLALAGLAAALPHLGALDAIASPLARQAACAAVVAFVGLPLGLAFPIGVRLASPLGERAVQRMWAVNGAASIAGSALSAIIAVAAGSRAVVFAAILCYLLAACAGLRARRAILLASPDSGRP